MTSAVISTHEGAQARSLRDELRAWLGAGDVQAPSGAYCAWRDAATGRLAFEYPEITGYVLTWLAGREELTDVEREAGRRAADWLVRRLGNDDRCARANWDAGAIYTFDLAMIAAGLQSFGNRVGNDGYERCGRELAGRLGSLIASRGDLPAIAPDGPPTTRPPEWSTVGRAHLIKCVQALLLAGEEHAATALVATAAEDQSSSGAMATQPSTDHVMLHPHLYAVEGLWMYATAREDDTALQRARRATEWAWTQQLTSGGFPRIGGRHGPEEPARGEQNDVTAQAIRAAVLVGLDPPGIEPAVRRLRELARPVGSGAALVYQPNSAQEHHNAWVTMFGAQALETIASSPETVRWHTLV